MATKLKSFSASKTVRFIIFILIVLLTTILVNYSYSVLVTVEDPGALLNDNYYSSTSFDSELIDIIDDILNDRPTVSPYVSYYYKNATNESGNPELVQTFPPNDQSVNIIYENEEFHLLSSAINSADRYYFSDADLLADPENHFYLTISPEYFASNVEGWQQSHDFLVGQFNLFMLLLLVILLLFVFLCFATGKSPDKAEITLNATDSLWSEITVLLIILGPTFFLILLESLFNFSYGSGDNYVLCILLALNTIVWTTFTGVFLLSMVRKFKSHTFLKTMFCYRFVKKSTSTASDFAKKIIEKTGDIQIMQSAPPTEQIRYREIIFISLSAAIVFFFTIFLMAGSILFLVPILLEALLIYWLIKGNAAIIENIDQNYEAAVEERMKSERMKVELITNMSHDLKTPLTSIISYVNLLSKDQSIEGTSREYLEILENKSDNLKNIVASLFDLSKSSSGNLNLNLEMLDLKKLLEQSIASLEDEIKASDLVFKIDIPEESIYIESDGNHLYRIFQNLLDNILKYAMSQSRVYIELVTDQADVVITMKNTSAKEISYTAEEILMRFTRGDQARESEGSGLGLSIAESFTQACGGTFDLSIDGDLFKTQLIFPITKKTERI
ncbi:HAMP domain-containing sensor histidine kinase [Eubacteriaceae bacterium ES2]|nr:HAMP domain-containing sensor histidine kinase [Eubacteriaceae bacterium ES2]